MRSTVVIASTRVSSRAAHAGQTCRRKRDKMKLPISLLVLVALSQALSVQPLTKRSEANSSVVEIPVGESTPAKSSSSKSSPAKSPLAKSSAAKEKDEGETSKRELYEGNYGERDTEPTPTIEYANELQDTISEQSPSHKIFGLRLPQIAKISDVLSEHGPSFEAALTKHLYSPVSVYQARLSSPTSFEVPTPAASQSPYSNPKAYKLQVHAENEQKLQEAPPKGVEPPSPVIPVYIVNQPRQEFEAYPQPLYSGLSRQHANFPQEIYRPNQLPKKVMSSLSPIFNQQFFRYSGQEVPSQILTPNGVDQIFPVRPDFGFGNQEGNRDKNYPNQENDEQLKAGQPKLQIEIPVPKQGYHAHPNGAISFASFSQNLPVNTQYATGLPTQQAQLKSQVIPQQPSQIQPEVMLQSQEQKFSAVKQKILIPTMFKKFIQGLQKYEPVYQQQPQFIPFKQQIQNQPRILNALQQHLLFQDPRQLPNPQLIQLQSLPAFKPLPQSQLSAESFLQQTSRSPVISERSPRPFSYDQSTENPENFNLLLESASTQLPPLPPLKPNYSKYVKPLEPHPHTTPVFLPTPVISTSTPKLQPVSDQLISSTTIQPNVKGQENPKEQSIQKESQPQSQTSQPLKPEITHQSQPTVRPAPIPSTTYQSFVTHEPQSIYLQYPTPQPVHPSSIRASSPRHDVVIQRQEIQELFFEPYPQPSSTLHNQNQHQVAYQQEQEVHHLQTQPHHQLFEQLQPLQYQQELQDINSQQYQLKARQSKSPQKQDSSQQGEHLQYLIQQHSHPLLQHFQPKLLQSQHSELEQLQQQQQQLQLVYQAQQHGSEQAQQQASEQAQQQQQASEQAQRQQQASEQAQQQQASEQAQQQQEALEQAQQQQQQASEQAQQQQEALEQAQQQQQQASEQAQQQQEALEQAQQQQQQASEQAQQQQEALKQAQQQQQQASEQAQQQQEALEQAQQQQQQASEQAQQQQEALEQAQQQQRASEQAQQQQQQASEQAQQQQEALEQAQQQQQQASEQAQQQQEALKQAQQQQQQASEQAQQQQEALEQAQQQQQQASEQAQQQQEALEQAQQQQRASEQAQQQNQHHLDTYNQIQISTLKPFQDAEKQTETVEIQQQPESQSQLQQQSNLQPTTETPKEQPDHLSEPTPNVEQPYVGPLLTSSDLPQIYAPQQHMVAQPEYSPLLGVPPYSNVQYFGKYAESLFGNRHH